MVLLYTRYDHFKDRDAIQKPCIFTIYKLTQQIRFALAEKLSGYLEKAGFLLVSRSAEWGVQAKRQGCNLQGTEQIQTLVQRSCGLWLRADPDISGIGAVNLRVSRSVWS